MRKSSKILAVILTLCLLLGAITAIFASAADEDTGVVAGKSSKLALHTNNSNKNPFGYGASGK